MPGILPALSGSSGSSMGRIRRRCWCFWWRNHRWRTCSKGCCLVLCRRQNIASAGAQASEREAPSRRRIGNTPRGGNKAGGCLRARPSGGSGKPRSRVAPARSTPGTSSQTRLAAELPAATDATFCLRQSTGLFPDLQFRCVPHEGKGDLEKSVVRKLRSWRTPGVRFVVMRDQNGGDCHAVKAQLSALCKEGGRPDSLVRVVCRELEAWYLGDLEALAKTFPRAASRIRARMAKRRFDTPDGVVQPARALAELVPGFRKRAAAQKMGLLLSGRNRSRSYQVFLAGVECLHAENSR